MSQKDFSMEEYENDIICKERLLEYNRKLELDTKENLGIDCTIYLTIDGIKRKLGFIELEKNRNHRINRFGKFCYGSIYHDKDKVDKYSYIEKGNNGMWLPSFYFHFTNDFEYISITKFTDINLNKLETIRAFDYSLCQYYNRLTYNDGLEKTVFIPYKDWEKVILSHLLGIFPYAWDLNRK